MSAQAITLAVPTYLHAEQVDLMTRLAEVTKGRVLQADEEASGLASGPPDAVRQFAKSVTNSTTKIKVAGPKGKPVDRTLYVDYFLTTTGAHERDPGPARAAKPSPNGTVRPKPRRRHKPSRTK